MKISMIKGFLLTGLFVAPSFAAAAGVATEVKDVYGFKQVYPNAKAGSRSNLKEVVEDLFARKPIKKLVNETIIIENDIYSLAHLLVLSNSIDLLRKFLAELSSMGKKTLHENMNATVGSTIRGASLEIHLRMGMTPLDLAVVFHKKEAEELLLSYGAKKSGMVEARLKADAMTEQKERKARAAQTQLEAELEREAKQLKAAEIRRQQKKEKAAQQEEARRHKAEQERKEAEQKEEQRKHEEAERKKAEAKKQKEKEIEDKKKQEEEKRATEERRRAKKLAKKREKDEKRQREAQEVKVGEVIADEDDDQPGAAKEVVQSHKQEDERAEGEPFVPERPAPHIARAAAAVVYVTGELKQS